MADLTYGYVAGVFYAPLGDEVSDVPLPVPLTGLRVRFTPAHPVKTTNPTATVGPQPVEAVVDDAGVLRVRNADGTPDEDEDVRLVPGLYRVRYSAPGGDFNLPTHDVLVTAEHTEAAPLDLTTAMPVGTVLSPSQYTELLAAVGALAQRREVHDDLYYPLEIPTYDGDPSVTHPDVLHFQAGWNGYAWWMAFTPFPDDPRENPSVVVSNDGINWIVPPGGTNPVTPFSQLEAGFTYFSDTDLCQLANGDLALYYRATNPTANQARIYRKTSNDGINWSAATTCITVMDSALLASPAVVREANGTFSMWSINTTTGAHSTRWEKRTSADGVTWSVPVTCSVPAIKAGGEPWHIDVFRDVDGYHALLMSNSDLNLYYRYSRDGVNWYGSDLIALPKTGASAGYYRATFIKSPARPGTFDVYAPVVDGFGAGAVERLTLMRGVTLTAPPDLETRLVRDVFIPATRFFATSGVGAATIGTVGSGSTQAMLLDAAATEQIQAPVEFPSTWTAIRVEAIWANAGAGTGDVVLSLKNDYLKVGTVAGAAGYVGANKVAAAGAASVVMLTELITSTPVSGGMALLKVLRRGADAADTLPNDIGLIGLRLTRVA